MASVSVYGLTRFTALAAGDILAAVDVSDSTQSAHGSLDSITAANFFGSVPSPIVQAMGTVVTSTPVYSATQTWNAAAVFVGLKLNVTDTSSTGASAGVVGSLLMQLQVGGANKFLVTKAGAVLAGGTDAAIGSLSGSQLVNVPSLVANTKAYVIAPAVTATLLTAFVGTSFAAPSAAGSGLTIGAWTVQATESTTALASGAQIRVNTTEAWSGTAHGCSMIFEVTPNTTAAVAVALTLGQDLSATFAGTIIGTGLATFSGGATVTSGQTLTVAGATITGLTAASVATGTFPGIYTITGALTLTAVSTHNAGLVTNVGNATIGSDGAGRLVVGNMGTTNSNAMNVLITNSTAPSGNPTAGGFLWVEGGALKFRGTAGTVSTIAPA